MTCRDHWQSSGHRFQNRVRHTFLVLIWRYFAWMQKHMRTGIKVQELRLRQKSDEVYIPENAQPSGKHFQFRLQRSFASDKKFRARIVFLKNRKSAQARRNTFLRN